MSMLEDFSIYDNPYSDETKIIRRNSLLMSALSLFVGLTEKVPSQFTLLGLKLDSGQQNILGWFMLSVTAYLLVHFISAAAVETEKWLRPFFVNRRLLSSKIDGPTYLFDLSDPSNDPDSEAREIHSEIKIDVKRKFKLFARMIYVKLIIEILVPIIVGIWATYELLTYMTK